VFKVGQIFNVKEFRQNNKREKKSGRGKRDYVLSENNKGRYYKSVSYKTSKDIAVDATIRVASINQKNRIKKCDRKIIVKNSDFRYKLRKNRIGNLIVFLVDASGSIGAQNRMESVKGAIMSLLLDSYQKRDKVAMISFRNKDAEILLNPTNSIELASKLLTSMKSGGRTPLSDGLIKAYDLIEKETKNDKSIIPTLVLVSDCKGNVSKSNNKPLEEAKDVARKIGESNINTICIDVEKKNIMSLNLVHEICKCINGEYYKIEDLKANKLVNVVRGELGI